MEKNQVTITGVDHSIAALTDNEKVLLDLCYDRLGKFKSPDIIHFMEDLPKGPSGKIQRMKLVDMLG